MAALSVSFNRVRTSFVIAHDDGFQVYSATTGIETSNELPALSTPIRCAAMMDNHPYVAIVRHMTEEVELWDCASSRKVHTFCAVPNKQVRSVLLTTSRAIVVCRDSTVLYDAETTERLAQFETATNERGLCALGGNRIALPGRTTGQVQVVNLADFKVRHVFPAHRSHLSALDISDDARYVATANGAGTIFKIFALPEQAPVKQLRRGVDGAEIYSLRMSPENAFLAATSGNGTLHVFTLTNEAPGGDAGKDEDEGDEGDGGVSIPKPEGSAKVAMDGSPKISHHVYGLGQKSTAMYHNAPVEDYAMVDEDEPSAPNSTQPAGPKFGILGKLPFAPSILTDQYPNASTKFDHGKATVANSPQAMLGPHPFGQLCWVDNKTVAVVKVQPDCVWEKFRVRNAIDEWKLERITSRQLAR